MLHSIDEYKLKSVSDILQQKLAKRGVPLKGLTHGVIESALGGTAKQKITCSRASRWRKPRKS